jgi:hypothetical protein
MHFRGPIELYQFAVYYPNTSSKKRSEENVKRHIHGHHHKRDDHVTTTTTTLTITKTVYVEPGTVAPSFTPSAATNGAPASAPGDNGASVGDYKRTGYYDADAGTADGLVFLGQKGGQGSGVFD